MSSKNPFESLGDLGDALPGEDDVDAKPLRHPLVWIDLEMTGLDTQKDVILQIAVIVTDGDLKRKFTGPELTIHQSEETLAGMGEWCRTHHGKSGLTQAVRDSRLGMAAAEERVLAFICKHVPEPGLACLAGSTVHTDLAFLRKDMPRIAAHLDYRIVDVTTLWELAKRWYPRVFRSRPKRACSHTAMSDIKDSIADLEHLRTRLFK